MVKVKGKSKCVALFEKIIEGINNGNKSIVCSIKNKKYNIVGTVNNKIKPSRKCTLKSAELPEMGMQLYNWFLLQCKRNMPVSAVGGCNVSKNVTE